MTEQTQNQSEQKVTLTLTVNQINVIIAGLDELPHKFSRKLLDEIQQQAVPQLQNNQLQGDLANKVVN